jgi:hypothetical protein
MSYRLTVFCSACNSPRGSRATASGAQATAGLTVAVWESLYRQKKGKRIHLIVYDNDKRTILSEHLPYIQDIHGNGNNVIDLYIGERDRCDCIHHPWSNKPCDYEDI